VHGVEKLERKVRSAAVIMVTLGVMVAAAMLVKGDAVPRDAPSLQTESAASLPLSGMTILVDAGHGGYDGGARARDSGVWEKEINLAVALETEKALAARGARVVMTRRTDKDLCEEKRPAALTKKRQDMRNRISLAVETTLITSPLRIWKLPLGICTWPSRSMAQIKRLVSISGGMCLFRSQSFMPSSTLPLGILKVTIWDWPWAKEVTSRAVGRVSIRAASLAVSSSGLMIMARPSFSWR
jgi:hypothetical protein